MKTHDENCIDMNYETISKKYFEGINERKLIHIDNILPCDAVMSIDGYKHSMVQIISIIIAVKGSVLINNPPLVTDTYVFVAIIQELGGVAILNKNTLYIDAKNISNCVIPSFLGRQIHGSMYLCPALLVALERFTYYGSGGCQIGDSENAGARPFWHIQSVMECLGGNIVAQDNCYVGTLNDNENNNEIDIMEYSTSKEFLSGPLVGGATKTAIILSIKKDYFVVRNAYLKTDVLDMLRFLKLLGKKVEIKNNDIFISGYVENPVDVNYTLTQCVSEIITYASLAIALKRNIIFKNVKREIIERSLFPEFVLFDKMGVMVEWDNDDLLISADCVQSTDIVVTPNTIQSDHLPFFVILLLLADSKSTVVELVWKDRFGYINNLEKMGAKICRNDNSIDISPSNLEKYDGPVEFLDVRADAATLVALIISKSEGVLCDTAHLDRGYSNLRKHLAELGVDISYVSE